MDIEIRMPELEHIKYIQTNPHKWIVFGPPAIYFKPFNNLYFRKADAERLGNKELKDQLALEYKGWRAKAKKLYDQLKKNFGIHHVKNLMDAEEAVKKGEFPMGVKDLDYIKTFNKRRYE
jgi:hypothetical protein